MSDKTPGPLDTIRAAGDVWQSDLSAAVARIFKWVVTIGVVGVVGAAWLGAWRYSDEILRDVLTPNPGAAALLDDGVIVEIASDSISLRPSEDTSAIGRDGSFGLTFPGGSGIVGPLLAGGSVVARQWTLREGAPEEGMKVGIDRDIYLGDPLQDQGVPFTEVDIPSPDEGDLPAWYVPGERSTWVIVIHDLGRNLTESLRTLPLFSDRGFPVLAISYRNDEGTFRETDARIGYGLTEWRDLQAAVSWARQNGAKKFILIGYGMGGGVSIEFMDRSPFAGEVLGLVLEAPTLDLGRAIDSSPGAMDIPHILRSLGKTIANFRFGINWSELDFTAKFEGVSVPVLLVHGVEDDVVPVELSDELAERYAELVTYLRVDGAGHGESWNVATAEYEAAVQQFLTGLIAADVDARDQIEESAPVHSE